MSATLPAGDYYVLASIGPEFANSSDKLYTDEGWVDFDPNTAVIADKGTLVHVDEGKTVELATNGLA